jgi:hypothetical protein
MSGVLLEEKSTKSAACFWIDGRFKDTVLARSSASFGSSGLEQVQRVSVYISEYIAEFS